MLLSLPINEITLSLFLECGYFSDFSGDILWGKCNSYFSIIITNIARELLSCLAQILNFQLTFKWDLGAVKKHQASRKFIFYFKLIVIFAFTCLVAT